MKQWLLLIFSIGSYYFIQAQESKQKDQKLYTEGYIIVNHKYDSLFVKKPNNQVQKLDDDTLIINYGNSIVLTDRVFLPRIGIAVIPFKNRIGINGQKALAEGSFTNVGLAVSLWNVRKRYYSFKGKSSEHNYSFPVLLSVSSLELSADNTDGKVVNKTKEPLGTIGLGFSYNYRGLELAIYTGYDFGLTDRIQTKWDYRGFNNWIGVGVGIKPSFIQSGLN